MIVNRTVPAESTGQRVDRFLADTIDELSRSRLKTLITEGLVLLDGATVEADRRVGEGECYTCEIPAPAQLELKAEDIPLNIVYEDSDLVVVNKSAGMVVHPAPGHSEGTLVNALLGYLAELPVINGEERPGIVHRLDKDTSGLIVVARNDRAMTGMQELFTKGAIEKRYHAIVRGITQGKGEIESEIGRSRRDRKKMASVETGGRYALSEYQLLKAYKGYSLIEVRIHTGRTHQIRVHMSDIGHPVVGDQQYGGRRNGVARDGTEDVRASRQMLHARYLSFRHPVKRRRLELTAEYPDDFEQMLRFLERGNAAES